MLASLKILHVSCAALSFTGFFIRGVWMLRDSSYLEARWVRVLPHLVDTLLLLSAIGLAVQLQLSPLQQPWLLAKILALLAYIGLGVVALRRGRTKSIRGLAWLAALLTFAFIVAVAVTRSPWGIAI